MATTSDIIRIACWRFSHDENGAFNKTSAEYATGITALPTPPTTLLGLYQAAVSKGAVAAELAPFYKHSALVADMKTALGAGNSADINSLIEIAVNLTNTVSDTTLNAVRASLSGQRLVDTVAAEPDKTDENGNPITMPESITEADVDAALGR